jgi:hypothetical protein
MCKLDFSKLLRLINLQFLFFFYSEFSVIDCLLSEWGQWSECDAKCGSGTRTRTRTILRAAEMGGKHCGSLIQRQGCEGYRCKTFSERKILSGK